MFRHLSYLLILLTPFVVGCSDPAQPEQGAASADSRSVDPGVIRLGYVERPGDIASAQVVRAVLEESGFGGELVPLAAVDLWQAIAVGEVDAMVGARLPVRHAHLYEPISSAVDNLGPNLKGLDAGLVVPGFVDLVSIADLAGQGERIGGGGLWV